MVPWHRRDRERCREDTYNSIGSIRILLDLDQDQFLTSFSVNIIVFNYIPH